MVYLVVFFLYTVGLASLLVQTGQQTRQTAHNVDYTKPFTCIYRTSFVTPTLLANLECVFKTGET